MAAATAPLDSQRKEADIVSYFMGAAKIYGGTHVSLRSDGYVYPSRSGTSTDAYVGVAYETADNSAGVAGAMRVRVFKEGTFRFAKSTSTAQSDMGTTVYASDDSTVTATSTNNQAVGKVVEVISSTVLRVRINQSVN